MGTLNLYDYDFDPMLVPDLYIPGGIKQIDFEELAAAGVRYYVVDVDNTVARWNSTKPDTEVMEALIKARANDWIKGVCILSNVGFGSKRVSRIAAMLGARCVAAYFGEFKPHPAPFSRALVELRALAKLPVSARNVAMIGDQIFTDILGANRFGLRSILVDPLGPDNPWAQPWAYFKRLQEAPIRRYIKEKQEESAQDAPN